MADSLGDRMKDYESRTGTKLVRKVPAIIRVDGKAFHTYTKGCKKPFDADIIQCMQIAAVKTAETIQGFKMGYVQSDEASFLLSDMDNVESEAWFDYKVQKIVSVAASTFGAYFNQAAQAKRYYAEVHQGECSLKENPAVFDARVFNIPENEITNYFLWRYKDWERNSLQMFCQSKFSHKEMQKKNAQMLHDMLHDVGENWADLNTTQKNGTWIFRDHLGIAGIYMFNNHPKLAFPDLDSMIRERVFLRSKV